MKRLLLSLLIISFFACQPRQSETSRQFEVHRGTNIAHWLSQGQARGLQREQFFTEADVKAIASMGFDHIRLPIDEVQMWDEEGKRHEDAFQLMLNGINWCAENNLRVIVDVHILRSHHFIAEVKPLWTDIAEQEKFYDLWRDLSAALHHFPNSLVAYELMNEAVADDPEQWNDLLANAVKAIRELEPERVIVIGSNRWQSVSTFDDLKVPEDDPNIILSFHYYEPMILTHYQAGWTEFRDYTGPVHYPGVLLSEEEYKALPDSLKSAPKKYSGVTYNKDVIFDQWQKPIAKSKELGLPLYCGEFGVYFHAPEADKLRWYEDIIQLLEDNNIGYANWSYKNSGFGLVDRAGNRHEELINIIVPESP